MVGGAVAHPAAIPEPDVRPFDCAQGRRRTRRRLGRSHGEGTDRHTEPSQETRTGHEGPGIRANLTGGDSRSGCGSECA